ncbi:hypothetical protein ACFE04_005735 [Oxalis oulophora]
MVRCLSASKSLRTLKLERFGITSTCLDFPHLKSLTLHDGTFCSYPPKDILVDYFSKCPSLETLKISEYSLVCRYRYGDLQRSQKLSALKSLSLHTVKFIDSYNNNLPINLFSSFVSLENLELTECSLMFGCDFIISNPRLVNLKLSLLTWVWGSEKNKHVIVSTPNLAYLKLEFERSVNLNLSIDNLTRLDTVIMRIMKSPIYIRSMNEENMDDYFGKLANLFQGFITAKSLYMSTNTIKFLNIFADKLHNQICPFNNLENLKLQVSSTDEVYDIYVSVSREVVRYLFSGSPKLKEKEMALVFA